MQNSNPYPDPVTGWNFGGCLFRDIRANFANWLRRSATRRHLCGLDDGQLDDVGLTRNQQDRECAKWFWE
ncbi:MAG: DUF1127 domain-containing protein [Rhodospirillales bacterium]|nr:DUF1127 domain-containing protein [Rhodospirillales bacterium]